MLQPLAAVESPCKYDSAYRPVRKHSDPDTHGTKSQDTDEKYAKTKSAGPHGTTGCDHGKLHISGRPESISRDKSHCPHEGFHNGDPVDHVDAHGCTRFFHATQDGDRSGQNVNDQAAYDNYAFCDNADSCSLIESSTSFTFSFSSGTACFASARLSFTA